MPSPTSVQEQDVIVVTAMQVLSAARDFGEFDPTNWFSCRIRGAGDVYHAPGARA